MPTPGGVFVSVINTVSPHQILTRWQTEPTNQVNRAKFPAEEAEESHYTLLSVPTAVVKKMYLLHLSDFWFKPHNRFTSDLGYLHFIYWLQYQWTRKGIIIITLHEYTNLDSGSIPVTVFSINVCTTKAILESENKAITPLSIFKYEK